MLAGRCVATTRTRGGGKGKPDIDKTIRNQFIPVWTPTDDETTEDKEKDEESDNENKEEQVPLEEVPTAPAVAAAKPQHTRIILEVSQLNNLFDKFPCPTCTDTLELKLRTVCISCSMELVCRNKDCNYIRRVSQPATTSIHFDDLYGYERMTDYAVNVLYVLGFISMGDAHSEAGRLLGFLGLPNDTTMMNRSFGIIEDRIGPFIRDLCEEIISENVEEEARLSMNELDFGLWKQWKDGNETINSFPVNRRPQIDASYDMARQQKGSGNVYNYQQDMALCLVGTSAKSLA